jgi:sialate O-acetylesterase
VRPELRRRPGGQWTPAGLFNAMVAPLIRMPIRGVIWYQGEANTAPERAPIYERLFPTMIRGWRKAWNQGAFPFLFVQLANYKGEPDGMWPEVREAQRNALALDGTAMAVSIDIGNPTDIHPKNKREVGRRLSLAARAVAYGEKVVYSGPLFRQATREGTSVRLWFDHTADGLRAKGALAGFEIAGADGAFQPAQARLDGSTVVVSHAGIPDPRRVRYAWSDNPRAALFNSEGLPASPFVSGTL